MGEERKKLHDSLRDELLKRQLSNSENLDRAILMLSSAGLGLSLLFIKDPFPLSEAAWKLLLYSSWILFGSAILSTLVSFFVSQQGIKKQLEMNTVGTLCLSEIRRHYQHLFFRVSQRTTKRNVFTPY